VSNDDTAFVFYFRSKKESKAISDLKRHKDVAGYLKDVGADIDTKIVLPCSRKMNILRGSKVLNGCNQIKKR